jgi:hypothetical protein
LLAGAASQGFVFPVPPLSLSARRPQLDSQGSAEDMSIAVSTLLRSNPDEVVISLSCDLEEPQQSCNTYPEAGVAAFAIVPTSPHLQSACDRIMDMHRINRASIQLPLHHENQGIHIDARTAATRWSGEKCDYGLGVEVLLRQARKARDASDARHPAVAVAESASVVNRPAVVEIDDFDAAPVGSLARCARRSRK